MIRLRKLANPRRSSMPLCHGELLMVMDCFARHDFNKAECKPKIQGLNTCMQQVRAWANTYCVCACVCVCVCVWARGSLVSCYGGVSVPNASHVEFERGA